LKIRPAVADDLAFVLGAARRLAEFGPPDWRPPEEIVQGEMRTLRGFFEAPAAGCALLIADSEPASPLGFVYLERLQDYFTLAPHGHVGMLVVTEEASGSGVGSALMRAAEAWASEQGYRKLTLTVFEGNRAARSVYEHLGYSVETLRYVKALGMEASRG
jgi:GNAT superfamily N-acetyltransferase